MAFTQLLDGVTLTANPADARVRLRVATGELAFLTATSASSDQIIFAMDYSLLDDPDVATDDDWWTIRDFVAGTLTNVFSVNPTGGVTRNYFDFCNRAKDAGSVVARVPAGVLWLRIGAYYSFSPEAAPASLWALYNQPPGNA